MGLQFLDSPMHNLSSLNCIEFTHLKGYRSGELGCCPYPRGHSQLLRQVLQLAVLTAKSLTDHPVVYLGALCSSGPFHLHSAWVND